ncbi:hypothetical protein C8R47DRAFT_981913, partial [Mycena vitilis]
LLPIPVSKTTFGFGGKTCARTQVALRLAWAVTIHKSRGLTSPKVKLGLGSKEFASGLTFVGLSRVKELKDLMILGTFDFSRVRKLAGTDYQHQLDDMAHRYRT